MMDKRKILFLSNGHGEDAAAVSIIKELNQKESKFFIKAMPFVGIGTAYSSYGIEMVGPLRELPSGGFAGLGIRNLKMDLKAGLIGLTIKQIRVLKLLSNETDLVVVCGDVFLVILAGIFVKKPIIFIATAKTEYINGHFKLEKLIMKRFTSRVFTRDALTAENLKKSGVIADFLGNPLMDALEYKGRKFSSNVNPMTIAFLPGSRDDSYNHICFFMKIIEKLELQKTFEMSYLISFFPELKLDKLQVMLEGNGWNLRTNEKAEEGLLSICRRALKATLVIGAAGDMINESRIVIGLSGTGNEQAAGLGKPVISFPTSASQYNGRFIESQKKLLGESLAVVDPDPYSAACEVLRILEDDTIYNHMSLCGINRMGPSGGAQKIALEISGFID